MLFRTNCIRTFPSIYFNKTFLHKNPNKFKVTIVNAQLNFPPNTEILTDCHANAFLKNSGIPSDFKETSKTSIQMGQKI